MIPFAADHLHRRGAHARLGGDGIDKAPDTLHTVILMVGVDHPARTTLSQMITVPGRDSLIPYR